MIFDMVSCGGCRTCEIACSYKHTGEFKPAISSIKILSKEDELGYHVLLSEEGGPQSMACDGCPEHEMPLCVLFCEKGEDLKEILKEFVKKLESEKRN